MCKGVLHTLRSYCHDKQTLLIECRLDARIAYDRTSTNKYIADKMYQDFIKDHNLSPLPHHLPVDTNPPEQRPWTFSRPTIKDSVGYITYSFSRIDDILLPTALANTCEPNYTCDLGYRSDHVPLLAIVPTCTLNLRIPHIVNAQAKKAAKQATLPCPVSASDQLNFTHALSDPSRGITGIYIWHTRTWGNPACTHSRPHASPCVS